MPDFRIVMDLKEVTEGDARGVALELWDDYARAFDVQYGEFDLRVLKVEGDAQFDIGWAP